MSSHADESLIYPRMKAFIARTAHIALIACWASSICGLLAWLPFPPREFLALMDLQLIFLILLSACLGILLPWCHLVLLYASGFVITRYLSSVGIILSLLTLISFTYSLIMKEALITNQGTLPILTSLLVLIGIVLNFLSLQALSWLHRIYLLLIPLLYLVSYTSSQVKANLVSSPATLLLLLVSYPLLKGLKSIAPRIISLPPKEDEESEDDESSEHSA